MLFLFSGVKVRCPGNPGHGSRFIENNAGEKVVSIFKNKTKRINSQLGSALASMQFDQFFYCPPLNKFSSIFS